MDIAENPAIECALFDDSDFRVLTELRFVIAERDIDAYEGSHDTTAWKPYTDFDIFEGRDLLFFNESFAESANVTSRYGYKTTLSRRALSYGVNLTAIRTMAAMELELEHEARGMYLWDCFTALWYIAQNELSAAESHDVLHWANES